MANYPLGQGVRLVATFRDRTSALADPTTAYITTKDPTDALVTYTSGVDLTRESLGIFYVDLVPTLAGTWYWRAKGTGAVPTVNQDGTFTIDQLTF